MAAAKKKLGPGRHASAIKRARQNIKRHKRNKHQLSTMRTMIKRVRKAGDAESLANAIPVIAKTAKNGTIHKRKASRLISRLTKFMQSQ